MKGRPIVIIGAGVAGLNAARILTDAQYPVLVIEARDRLGGRVLTVDASGHPADDGFDLGPSWFWPQAQPAIGELVESLGLASFAQHSRGDVMFERMSREGPRRYQGGDQEALSFRVAGGSAALVHACARTLQPHQVRLGARVTQLTLADDGVNDGVELTVDVAGVQERLWASHVIAALPPRLFEATCTFAPALDAHTAQQWRNTPTWMAPHAKFFAVYDRPFWREAGLCGTAQSMVGPMPEIHDATTASGQAALFGFVGVGAEQRLVLGEEALSSACVAQLVRLFGAEAAQPRATLVKDWAADSLTATPLDRLASGHPVPFSGPWVTGAWAGHLVLGGSEVSPVEPGYLAGAVTAGAQAAAMVMGTR